MNKYPTPNIPISWGELIDKITILEIKRIHITSTGALFNIENELSQLKAIVSQQQDLSTITSSLYSDLFNINSSLWNIEDAIREKEKKLEFDSIFIELARNVYKFNDQRSIIKKQINLILKSELIEEKSYSTSSKD